VSKSYQKETMQSTTPYIPNLAIVVTTFERQELLQELLDSIAALEVLPKKVFIVDNENSPKTKALVGSFPWTAYIAMKENSGGAGGFSRGIKEAYSAGFDWVWAMDDDVKVLPKAIEKLSRWMRQTEEDLSQGKDLSEVTTVYQGLRKNFDGTFFYWQYHFINKLAIPNPVSPSGFDPGEDSRAMNTACFEGSLFHRSIIERIGLPDARFFIYWDDTMYGYLASKHTGMLLVTEYVLQRSRSLESLRIGVMRRLNTTSDFTRYYIMRNRGHMAHYLRIYGDYNRFLFGFGTFLTFIKEIIRLSLSKDFRSGFSRLVEGFRDSRKILKEPDWQPYAEIMPLD